MTEHENKLFKNCHHPHKYESGTYLWDFILYF